MATVSANECTAVYYLFLSEKKAKKHDAISDIQYVGFSSYSKLNTHHPPVIRQLCKTMISSDEKTLPATSFSLKPLMLPNSSLLVQLGNDTTN